MTTTAVADPGPPPLAPPRSNRFFAWTSGIGIVRGDGWIGGVAAGVAARLRIDPLIVRGILVVTALFGLPALLAYAVAWAVLPDLGGRIHLQDALRGRFSAASIGIVLFAVAGLLPAPLAVALGLPTLALFADPRGAIVFAFFGVLGLAVIAGLVFFIVRSARRAPGAPVPDLRTASAASEAPDSSIDESASGADPTVEDEAMDAAATEPASIASSDSGAEPYDDAAPIDDSAPIDAQQASDELAAWREQHAAWRAQDAQWRREQQDAARAAREQARRERHAHGAQFSAEAAERRRVRRATSPRTSAAFVAVVLGAAAVLGAVTALSVPAADRSFAPAMGLFCATLVVGLGMFAAGALRRRSGFLAFVAIVLLVVGAGVAALPLGKNLVLGDTWISNAAPERTSVAQPFGWLGITVLDTGGEGEPITVRKGTGTTEIRIEAGVEVHLTATLGDAWVQLYRERADGATVDVERVETTPTADGRFALDDRFSTVDEPTTRQQVTLDQTSGSISIYLVEAAEEDAS
ncbi:PspC domain-containing protein [Microbacterium fluvii]|uniref:PspC domain-containing protein n=1 Tax=Microbacterium fluvii TaxID=415215 RepID=A0ABW2HD15_9MICO|nr:PspC domain-containing protein [Microbacterium fluvii]MCU4671284.1 PspC domain-containing protein [Microbacterium fluvii]